MGQFKKVGNYHRKLLRVEKRQLRSASPSELLGSIDRGISPQMQDYQVSKQQYRPQDAEASIMTMNQSVADELLCSNLQNARK
jgi:hypothetical protein